MQKYRLYNGIEIPVIGLGTFPYKEELINSIPKAISYGYELIDTSDNYGNEKYIGKAVCNIKNDCQKIMILTKFSNPNFTILFNTIFGKSRRNLKRKADEPIDIYLLHWPYPFLWKKCWRRMEKLYISGKCKAIGVCNFEKEHLQELLEFSTVKPMINQIECHPMFQQLETVNFCKENNIQVMSYSPFARMDEKLIKNSVLVEISEKYNKSVQQVILRWNIQNGLLPIPASISEKHMLSNITIFDFDLDELDMKKINNLEIGMRVRFDPKTRFSDKYKTKYKIISYFCK